MNLTSRATVTGRVTGRKDPVSETPDDDPPSAPALFASLSLAACGKLIRSAVRPSSALWKAASSTTRCIPRQPARGCRPRCPDLRSSLWTGETDSLFGDRRAAQRGDILTVVIEIDDRPRSRIPPAGRSGAQQKWGSRRCSASRSGSIRKPARRCQHGRRGRDESSSDFQGPGQRVAEGKLTLRVAATVVEELPNGVLRIEGQQEVRVNFEMRELIVTGYVRPADISRQNEITYDKIAGARIAYGGRGQITDVQQPTYGQQVADIVMPF
jgi:flagellar L-ring protein precursor FlgH